VQKSFDGHMNGATRFITRLEASPSFCSDAGLRFNELFMCLLLKKKLPLLKTNPEATLHSNLECPKSHGRFFAKTLAMIQIKI